MLPNFLFIGPDKTGSSWLFEMLRSHPACFVPSCKDIYYFDRHYSRGIEWYHSFFRDAPTTVKAVGELSHDYLFSEEAAQRIFCDLPGVRLITSLRNPIDRTFSHYLYMIRSGRTRLSFEEALRAYPELVRNSMYYQHLSRYYELFAPEKIKVLWFDDLEKNPEMFAHECLVFLKLENHPNFDFSKKIRAASMPRSYILARMAKMGANAARTMRLERLVGFVKHSRFTSFLYKPYEPTRRPKVGKETACRLIEIFSNDIAALERLVEVNLDSWKEVPKI